MVSGGGVLGREPLEWDSALLEKDPREILTPSALKTW
jgi:hypothetical protein